MKNKTKKSKTKGLKIMYSNCDGIKSKQASLRSVIVEKEPDIILLVETKLKPHCNIKIPGYQCITENRTHQGGGGLVVIIKKLISTQLL